MKDAARIAAVIELLAEVMATPKPADGLISAAFRARRYIGSKDRNAIAGQIYALLRHHFRFGWWIQYLADQGTGSGEQKTDKEGYMGEARKRLMLYLALVNKESIASISKYFSGERFCPALLSDEEKKFLKALEGRTLFHPQMPDAARLECPPVAFEKLQGLFGAEAETELLAMQTEAPLDIRVNTLTAGRADILGKLKAEGIKAVETPLSPWGLRLEGRPPLAQLALFREGHVEIQDEGSQLIALLLAPKPGMSVVDFCAGAGGKTLALAALMENKGRIVACDVLGGRLKRGRERFRRAGAHNIEVRELKHERDDWVKRSEGKYDRVLVDAPCSGTGTWRRNPDARWKELGPKLEELTGIQARILASASRLVKKGGQLVYATCSLLPEENQQQVEVFLKEHSDFKHVEAGQIIPAFAGKDFLQITPAKHGTDGFFAALLERV